MSASLAVLVVTHNRKDLLRRCLRAIASQTMPPNRIFVVDNASTDGTSEMLVQESGNSLPLLEVLLLPENTGGAGGFSAGLAQAASSGADWIWLMDDDAVPHIDALERLMEQASDPRNLYGSAAVSGNRLAWPMLPVGGRATDEINSSEQLVVTQDVHFIPFLGLLVSATMIARIGVPDAGFFIAADDVDYCLRARHCGARIILVGDSRIEHPASVRHTLRIPGSPLYVLQLPPWKRYYDVRNRILVARNHHGLALYYGTIPATFVKLVATLAREPNRMMQLRAFLGGMIDGFLARKGRRHDVWGLRP